MPALMRVAVCAQLQMWNLLNVPEEDGDEDSAAATEVLGVRLDIAMQ